MVIKTRTSKMKSIAVYHPFIHPCFGGSRLSRDSQTCLPPATSFSSFWGTQLFPSGVPQWILCLYLSMSLTSFTGSSFLLLTSSKSLTHNCHSVKDESTFVNLWKYFFCCLSGPRSHSFNDKWKCDIIILFCRFSRCYSQFDLAVVLKWKSLWPHKGPERAAI